MGEPNIVERGKVMSAERNDLARRFRAYAQTMRKHKTASIIIGTTILEPVCEASELDAAADQMEADATTIRELVEYFREATGYLEWHKDNIPLRHPTVGSAISKYCALLSRLNMERDCSRCGGTGRVLVDCDEPFVESAKSVPCPSCSIGDESDD